MAPFPDNLITDSSLPRPLLRESCRRVDSVLICCVSDGDNKSETLDLRRLRPGITQAQLLIEASRKKAKCNLHWRRTAIISIGLDSKGKLLDHVRTGDTELEHLSEETKRDPPYESTCQL